MYVLILMRRIAMATLPCLFKVKFFSQDHILGYISPLWLPNHQASDESRCTDETGHASQVVISLIFYSTRFGFESHGFPS